MSRPSQPPDLLLTDSDIDALFGFFSVDPIEPGPGVMDVGVAPSEELAAVARRVSSQYVDIVAVVASQLLSGAGHIGSLDQLEGALQALRRLADVHEDGVAIELIDELFGAGALWRVSGTGKRGRLKFLNTLRGWLPRYGRVIAPEDGARLRDITEYDPTAVPLFAELEAIRGVGPRRLQRLYCAGLFTVDALCNADPIEVSQVTGLPRELTTVIVERTRAFAAEHRRRTIANMRARVSEFVRLLAEIDPGREPELAQIARTAILDMRRLVHDELRGTPQ